MASIKDDIRFAVDPVAFAEDVLPRIDPDIKSLDPWQRDFLETRARRMLVNAFRQSGKSTLTGILALHRALYYPRSLVLILAPSLRQAGEFFEKVSMGFAELSGGGLAIEAESDRKLGIKLTNGSRIEALPGSQKSTRGFSKPSLIIIDEAAQIDDALYTGVMPMLTRAKEGGRLLMLSTPFGRRGVYWRLWEESTIFQRVRVPYTDVDWISPSIIEEARETLLDWEFKQEYLCTFEQNQMAVFDVEDFRASTTDEFDPIILRRSA
jgi:Terminase large subunit, T4likevirus-type, N-terminal